MTKIIIFGSVAIETSSFLLAERRICADYVQIILIKDKQEFGRKCCWHKQKPNKDWDSRDTVNTEQLIE